MVTRQTQQAGEGCASRTKSSITQQQSLEVTQFLLYGGLSMLAWTRNFFHDKAFKRLLFHALGQAPQYQAYMDGEGPTDTDAKPRVIVNALQRKRSRRADLFLDWLENGVLPALQASQLHSVQIYVHADDADREKALETYTFSVQYQKDANNGVSTPLSLQLDGPDSVTTLEATMVSLMLSMQQMGRVISRLPDLPATRFVSMRIVLNDNAPAECAFHGFEETPDRQMTFAAAAGWSMNVAAMDRVASSFHSTTMKVTHLQHPPAEGSAELDQIPAIPSTLQYVTLGEEHEEVDNVLSAPVDDGNMKKMLRGMMEPELLTQGDTQAQSLARSARDPSGGVKIDLVPAIIARLQVSHSQAYGGGFDPSGAAQKFHMDSHVVCCQCGHDEEVDDMVCCCFCNRWQHLHCCGYSGIRDPRLPETHACLRCVLGHTFEELSMDLRIIALRRRAMSFAFQGGLRTKTNLAEILVQDIDRLTSDAVFEYLRREALVLAASGSHKPGFAAAGKPKFVPNTTAIDKIVQLVFNPLTGVARNYVNKPDIDPLIMLEVGKQLLALRAKTMPPPATPLQSMQSNSATPLTNLDLRQSAIPFATPVRLGQKRPFDVGGEEADAKRSGHTRRVKSVRSTQLLNINGLSSSPVA